MKLAVVGYGSIAEKHAEVFRALGADIVASCNRSEAGRARAKANGIEQTFDRIEDMLAATLPDGVLCCASIHENFEAARRVLPFGIPTLLEKPPGIRPEELEELIALKRAPVMLALNRLHYSVLLRAIEDAGGIDAITSVHVDWSEDPAHLLNRGFTHQQILRRNASNSVHGITLLTHLAGELVDLQIALDRIEPPYRLQMAMLGRSQRDVLCSFRSSWDAPVRWRLAFTAKGKSYELAPLERCLVRDPNEHVIEPSPEDQRFKPGFHRQASLFLEAVQSGAVETPFTLESFRPAMAIADALSRAIEQS